MADFRKLFSAFALVALMLGFGLTASAQSVNCTAAAGSPPILRAEGYTELAGDIILDCTQPAPTAFTMTLNLFATTNITSRLLTSASTGVGTSTSTTEALLLTNGTSTDVAPAAAVLWNGLVPPAAVVGNAFRGSRVNNTQLVWAGIPVTPTGTTFRIRITNVRVNATTVAPVGNFPGQVSAFITVSGTLPIVVNAPTQIIGAVQNGLSFSYRTCSDGSTSSTTGIFNQCKQENKDLTSTSSTATSSAQFGIKFSEGFSYAFKKGLLPPPSAGVPGQDGSTTIGGATNFNSESGYANSTVFGSETGFASLGYISASGQNRLGTRLIARFQNVPVGAAVYVATTPCLIPGTTTAGLNNTTTGGGTSYLCGSSTIYAQLLQGTDANGYGGSPAATTSTNVVCSNIKGIAVTQVPIDATSNSGFAVWEVVNPDPNISESIVVQVAVRTAPSLTANPPTPATGTATAYGNLAPAYASGTGADAASATLPVPRFLDKPSSTNVFTINVCQTTLLFPFVTTAVGFDTGIALSNTSLDPFNRKSDGTFDQQNSNQGACTLYFWQNGTFTGADAKTGFVTPVVPAGSTLAFTMFNGIPLSDGTSKSIQNFSGYMIAQCQFLYAHGYAFISDLGAQKLAQGYLALVMGATSDRSWTPAITANENLNN